MEYLPTLKKILLAGLLLPLGWACEKTPEVLPTMLDGDVIFDPNIYKPDSLLVSYAYPNPAAVDAAKPVIIACHGYTATTFEWNELRTYMGGRNDMYLSQVLLGGHGRTYEDFKNSTWKDWQLAITEEYDRLQRAGYTNLNFVCSSTSCPLILDLFASGYFEGKTIPATVLMVDPIVVSSAKSLSLIGVVGPMLGYIEAVNTPIEDKYWYHFRPQETLQQLQNVLTTVRKELQKGIDLPPACSLKVYKSIRDAVADPVSAVLIYQGVTQQGNAIEVDMIDSDLHVFTRLDLRENLLQKDLDNQTAVFDDILTRVAN